MEHECLIYTFNRSIQKENNITFSISPHLLLFYICQMCGITEATIMKEIYIISPQKKVFKVYNNIIWSQNTQYYGGNSILITAWNIIMVRHLHAKFEVSENFCYKYFNVFKFVTIFFLIIHAWLSYSKLE